MGAKKTRATTSEKQPTGFARLDPQRRKDAARLGAYSRVAKSDPQEMTAAARLALADSWQRKADPDGVLPLPERARRAEALRQAHYARMRLARWGKTA